MKFATESVTTMRHTKMDEIIKHKDIETWKEQGFYFSCFVGWGGTVIKFLPDLLIVWYKNRIVYIFPTLEYYYDRLYYRYT